MLILVIGGSGSGKSEYAERRCSELSSGKKLYIAAMEPCDEEGFARVARHRRMRDGKGFDTLECHTHLEQAKIPPCDTVLLECLSNLLANEMFSPDGRQEAAQAAAAILRGVMRLAERVDHVVVVTNQVFSDGVTYTPETELYRQCLAKINREIGSAAVVGVEVVRGIPVVKMKMEV